MEGGRGRGRGRGREKEGCKGGGVKGILSEVKKRKIWEGGEKGVHLYVCAERREGGGSNT